MQPTSADFDFACLCRVGFERDLVDELGAWLAATAQAHAELAVMQDGVVRVRGAELVPALSDLVFARDQMIVRAELPALGIKDRVTPIAAALDEHGLRGQPQVLTPDSEATKPLAPLIGALAARLGARAPAWPTDVLPVVWMLAGTHALVGHAPFQGGAVFAGGVPRLKFPREAPSRSTLKLEEAFHVLLTQPEREQLLRAGASAVDLGAAPGGWTYQLVAKQISVVAIDNGNMDGRLLESGLVDHRREDGFRYRPLRSVDWLVCDMVEKPARVVELMLHWFKSGWCRAAIFNLKLPMKRRFEAWAEARAMLAAQLPQGYALRARQLYHDREEITVAIVPGRGVASLPRAIAKPVVAQPTRPGGARSPRPALPAAARSASAKAKPPVPRGTSAKGKPAAPRGTAAKGKPTAPHKAAGAAAKPAGRAGKPVARAGKPADTRARPAKSGPGSTGSGRAGRVKTPPRRAR